MATDATGGPRSSDNRMKVVAWAAIAFRKLDQTIQVVGTWSGLLPHGATEFQGESYAVSKVLSPTTTAIDITTRRGMARTRRGMAR